MSSSKSSASTASNVTDRRIGATDSAIVATEGSQVVVTDSGAIAANAIVAQNAIIENSNLARLSAATALEQTEKAISGIAEVTNEGFDFAGMVVNNAFGFSEDLADDSFDLVKSLTADANKRVDTANKYAADIAESSISAVELSTRSESSEIFNKLLQTTTIVAVGYIAMKAIK